MESVGDVILNYALNLFAGWSRVYSFGDSEIADPELDSGQGSE